MYYPITKVSKGFNMLLATFYIISCYFLFSSNHIYLQQGSKEYQFLDRLEIKAGTNTPISNHDKTLAGEPL